MSAKWRLPFRQIPSTTHERHQPHGSFNLLFRLAFYIVQFPQEHSTQIGKLHRGFQLFHLAPQSRAERFMNPSIRILICEGPDERHRNGYVSVIINSDVHGIPFDGRRLTSQSQTQSTAS